MSLEGAIAAHRFGLGARPGEIAAANRDPKGWLIAQLEGGAPELRSLDGRPFPNSGRLVAEEEDYKLDKFLNKGNKAARREAANAAAKQAPGGMEVQNLNRKGNPKIPGGNGLKGGNARKQEYWEEMSARFALGATTSKPFAERVVRFWSNHFAVSGARHKVLIFAGAFEREAIRPFINGTFEDMLFAVTMHPAMQVYLDNFHSVGPNSAEGVQSNHKKGLNENLGRELMELHTLGVDGGYTQADVTAMAKLLTGWGLYDGRASGFGFYETRHEPGPIKLRGKTYPPGWGGSVAAVKDLAHDPATARHIARKFATHFVADNPPPESVKRLEKVFLDTRGNLHALSETVVNDPAAWQPQLRKMRTPVEYVTAAMRASDWKAERARELRRLLGAVKMMGEVPFGAPSPKGWPDTSDAWSGSDGLLDRIQWAQDFGSGLGEVDAGKMASESLGPLLNPNTRNVMAKARSKGEAVALLLSSPEFQRR